MFETANPLSPEARTKVARALNASLADGLDLQTQVKTAHWNVKGPHFASLHELFDTFASSVAEHNDEIAERAVALGALAAGTARTAAKQSRVPELPADATDGLALVKALAERFGAHLAGLRAARKVADEVGDGDTSDLVTVIVTDFEKHAWMLHATLAR